MRIDQTNINDLLISGYENEYIFEIIKKTGSYYEYYILKNWFDVFKDSKLILDVGANLGNHSMFWSTQLKHIDAIYAFEPLAENFELLEKNIKQNNLLNIIPIKQCVGKNTAFAHVRIKNEGNLGATQFALSEGDESESVEVITIDELVKSRRLDKIDAIKIDTEGWELDVLNGAKKTIIDHRPVLWIELTNETYQAVFALMQEYDYSLIDVESYNVLYVPNEVSGKYTIISKDSIIKKLQILSYSLYSKFYYEQNKSKDLLKRLQERTSNFEYEQKKAESLLKQLQERTSNFEYEQKKAENYRQQLQERTSNFEYEQKKAESLLKQLQERTSNFEFEQKKVEELRMYLQERTSNFEYEQKKASEFHQRAQECTVKYEAEQKNVYELRKQLLEISSNLEREQNKSEKLHNQLKEKDFGFETEQKKSEELHKQLQDNYTRLEVEQKKSEELHKQLQDNYTRLEVEQKNSDDLHEQWQKSKLSFESEQKKVKELNNELEGIHGLLDAEVKKSEALKNELDAMTLNYENEKKASEYNYKQLQKRTSNYKYEQKLVYDLRQKLEKTKNRLDLYDAQPVVKLMVYKWRLNKKYRDLKKRVKSLLYAMLGLKEKNEVSQNLSAVSKETVQKIQQVVNVQEKAKKAAKLYSDFNVAAILDEFTYNSFKYECKLHPLEPNSWKDVFENNDIDFFFCESAWSGADSKFRPWKGKIYCSTNFTKENRTILFEILEYCKENDIPTVFWNKEDPTHYPDKIHNFTDTASRFNYIFTTDFECVEKYKKDFSHANVSTLMFATQPKLFNPIEKYSRTDDVIFAGGWYKQHPKRSEEMSLILDEIIASDRGLKIFNRYSESTDDNHVFPERYHKYLLPALPHNAIEEAYKSSKYALNINTVIASSTMFARRIFELISSNTYVLSNYSKGIDELFGKYITFVGNKGNLELTNVDEKRENALYNVLTHHTYKNRFLQILNTIGLDYLEAKDDVTLIYTVSSVKEADEHFEHFSDLRYNNKKAIFFIAKDAKSEVLRAVVEKYNNADVNVISEDYCLKYDNVLNITSTYFIFANKNLSKKFIGRAILHFSYLEKNVGIVEGSAKYSIVKSEVAENTMFPAELFIEIRNNRVIFNKKALYNVYTI